MAKSKKLFIMGSIMAPDWIDHNGCNLYGLPDEAGFYEIWVDGLYMGLFKFDPESSPGDHDEEWLEATANDDE